MQKIIIVEDDTIIREELSSLLSRYGYDVKAPTEFTNILDYIINEKAHILLLDINLPLFDGYYICKEIRKVSDIPIIIVTSRDTQVDELISMNLGADDFITKPYNTEILLARISSILRRTYGNQISQDTLSYKDLIVNLSNATITYNNTSLELTKNELKILSCLLKNKGKIVPREDLMNFLWNSDCFIDDNTLSVNVTRLRKKLSDLGIENAIETKRGLGYIIA